MPIRVSLVASALVVAALAGCGGSDTASSEPLTPAMAAVKQALDKAPTESFRYSATYDGESTGSVNGEYVVGPPVRNHVTVTVEDDPFGNGTFETIAIGGDTWIRAIGATRASVISGMVDGQWAKKRTFSDDGLTLEFLDVRTRPRMLLAAGDLAESGARAIDSVRTVRYAGTVTLDSVRAAAALDPRDRAFFLAALSDAKGPILVEGWLDPAQRLHRYLESGKDLSGKFRVRIDFRDFGTAFTITPPV